MTDKKRESVPPPTQKELTDASRQTREGHSSGGRTLREERTAREQHVNPPKSPPSKRK